MNYFNKTFLKIIIVNKSIQLMNSNHDDDRFESTKNKGSPTLSLMEGSEYLVISLKGVRY